MDERTERRAEAAYERFRRTRGPLAMAEVFDLTAPELLSFARRFAGGAAAAEDLVQQTFVRAIERAEQFDPARRLLPWLMAILANEARMERRRAEPDPARVAARAAEEPPHEAVRGETRRAVDAALAALPAEQREVITLRHLHGLPPRRIAAALSIPVATVKTRLKRGTQRLAASLPPGLAFGAAMSLISGCGIAAVRRAVLTHAGASAPVAGALGIAAILIMNKTLLVGISLAAATAALVALSVLTAPPDGPPHVAEASRPAAAIPLTGTGPEPTATTPAGVRTAAPPVASVAPTGPPPADETVAIDLTVRAVWQASRRPAARVPLQLHVLEQPLAHGWTDDHGVTHFVLTAPAWHWQRGEGGSAREVSVCTPLMPGRTFVAALRDVAGEHEAGAELEIALAEGQQVHGTVVDADGQPVAGARVWLAIQPYPEVVVAGTDAGGEFTIGGLPVGFVLRATNGTRTSKPATVADLGNDQRLLLRLGRDGAGLHVRVVASGRAVAGATVRLDASFRGLGGEPSMQHTTDAHGSATFAGVPTGVLRLEVLHHDHPPAQREVGIGAGDAHRVETVELGAVATLVGIVRRGGRGVPTSVMLDGAGSLFHRDLHADEEGRFRADRVAVGPHRLFFRHGATSCTRLVELHAGEQTIEFELPGGATIAGRLLLPDDDPAARWNVAARRVDAEGNISRAITGPDGAFEFVDEPEGHYLLRAEGPAGGAHEFFGVRTDGVRSDYRLPPAALWQPAAVSGHFADVPDGASLHQADAFGHGGRGQRLDGGGAFELGPLAPGRHRLWLEHANTILWLTEIELASGEHRDLGAVALPRAGSIAVALRALDVTDVAAAHVVLRAACTSGGAAFGPPLRLAADGLWRCERVPSGSWWILVGGDGIAPDAREVFVVPGGEHHLDVGLARAVDVKVRYRAGSAGPHEVGVRRETVRRAGDGVILSHRRIMGPLRTFLGLGVGSHVLEIETAGGFRGSVTLDVTSPSTVDVALTR
jgi:RNA polymerase sigma factor (sigma-70 family)